MRGLGRWVWVLLLVLALPLKAIAATGAFACLHGSMPGHAPASMVSEAAEVHEGCHGHGADHHASHTQTDDAVADALWGCSACAPCCAATAPAPESTPVRLPDLPVAFAPQVQALAEGVVGDVPHQPPR